MLNCSQKAGSIENLGNNGFLSMYSKVTMLLFNRSTNYIFGDGALKSPFNSVSLKDLELGRVNSAVSAAASI